MLIAVRVLIECRTDAGERLSVDLESTAPRVNEDPLAVVNDAVDRVRAAMLASEPGAAAPPRRQSRKRTA